MLLRIQPYNCTIQYIAGKEMIFADYLSRVSPTTAGEIQLDKIVHPVSISDEKYKALQDATAKDSELMCLKSQIIKGWPDNAKEVPQAVRKYWSMRDFIYRRRAYHKKHSHHNPKEYERCHPRQTTRWSPRHRKMSTTSKRKCLLAGMTKDITEKVQSQIPHIIRHDSKSEGITRHLEQRQAVQKGYFDRQAHDLPPFSKTSKCQSRIPALDCGPRRLSSNTVVGQGATSSRLPTAQHSEETAYTSRLAPEHDLLIIHHNLMMMTLEIMQLQRGKVCVNIQAVPLTTRQLGPQVYLLVPLTRQAK
ncbi:hypothetical protein ElyMa_006260100 [Elysia marginata]|uniref:Uncharacterized protein n=1 Tax=Elysia marginata TaxID=1093978 RepID=A0AAV4HCS5_9GAST|nr:hypothetical protein ElyMa_006260100 [Elysia marginata]